VKLFPFVFTTSNTMKFSTAFTAFVVVVPLFSGQALAAAQRNKGSRAAPPLAINNATNNTASDNNTASNNSTTSDNTNNAASNNNGGDPQTSFTLDPSVVNTGSTQTGQQNATAGQSDSLTSTNNFINSCIGKTITDGLQIKTGSCNPIPMGDIPSVTNMPACAFQSPQNGEDIAAGQTFTISLGTQGMQTGDFTNAATTYFAAPQQLNNAGQIVGHNHITVQAIKSLTDTTIPNPQEFAFFKGLNAPAQNGVLTASVTGGLAPGFYKCCSITTSANHVPVICPVAQHGSFDDCIRFSVGQGNANDGNGTPAGNSSNTDNTGANGGNNNSTDTNGGNNNSTVADGGNNSTVTNGGNNNSTSTNGGNNKNTGKTGGNFKKQGNRKGRGGRDRRMVARLSRDY
jgi:transcription initiation factor TFIID subunit 15